MRKITVLYPTGRIGYPTTGGQIYDFRLFEIISDQNVQIDYITNETLNRKQNESALFLPFRMFSKLKSLGKNKILIFNTTLFPYYIIPFFILRLVYPHVKLFGIHHHFRFQEQKGLKRRIYKFLEFVNLKQCEQVINPCPYTGDILLKSWKKGRVLNLENSFEITSKPFSNHKPYKLLYVGSVYERKGIIYLLQALSTIPANKLDLITLDIVGNMDESSEYVKSLRNFVKNHKLEKQVIFHGRQSEEKLREFYSNAYAFILPSLLEGYGLVIIEAMAYGLPVVAFDNSAMPYTIKNEYNGLLAKNKDIESLRDNILRIIDDRQLHAILSSNAKITSENVHTIEDLNEEVINWVNTWNL